MNRTHVTAEALALFDQRWATQIAQHKITVTCFKGCSACCSEPVYVTKDEARLTLARLPDADRPEVAQRTNDWLVKAQANGILDDPEPYVMSYLAVGLVCPLLKDNLCRVYPYRPFACRSHCAVGPASRCASDRMAQRYARSSALIVQTGAQLYHICSEGDHLGVWLARLLLQSPVRSQAHTSADGLKL